MTKENCCNTGTVNGKINNIGGVAGSNSGTIKNCYNQGTVSGSSFVGGVAGSNSGTMENCCNQGTVSGSNNIGGIAGHNSSTIKNCYNQRAVGGSYNIGGVVGYNYNDNSIIENCYNMGTVNGSYSVGGVVGAKIYGTITNNYYCIDCAKDGNETSQYGIGNENIGSTTANMQDSTIGKNTEDFKSPDMVELLGSDVWEQGEDYPVLKNQYFHIIENMNEPK